MKFTKTPTIVAVAIVQAIILLTPAQGQHFPGDRPDYDRSYRQTDRDIDRIIWRAYREILQQDPDSEGLHYYSSRTRAIFFRLGRAMGADTSEADPGKFSATREGDLHLIRIGGERYEIPDAVVLGG